MRSALLVAPGAFEIHTVETPVPVAGEVLIRPARVGICGSDMSLYLGHRQPKQMPITMGHEMVGRVMAVGPGVTRVGVGQRVIVEPNYVCGQCPFCRAGRGTICPNKQSMGLTVPGSFAEYVTAPAEFTWPVPDGISDADAASIEPLAVAWHAMKRAGSRSGDTVAVLGCGVIGLLLIHVAAAQGTRVLAHDRVAAKLRIAKQLGADIDHEGDPAELWLREDVSTVFECAGAAAAVELSIGAAPRGSTVMLLGLSTSPASFVPLRLVREGIRIEPSLIYDHPDDFETVIRLVAQGHLAPSRIVTDTLPFDEIGRAFELAREGDSGKVHVAIT
jgi:threonine dehydrogenase-like Zn-dependent dehydrogenase